MLRRFASKLRLCLAADKDRELLRVGRCCSATAAACGTKRQFCSKDCWSALVRGYLVVELLAGRSYLPPKNLQNWCTFHRVAYVFIRWDRLRAKPAERLVLQTVMLHYSFQEYFADLQMSVTLLIARAFVNFLAVHDTKHLSSKIFWVPVGV